MSFHDFLHDFHGPRSHLVRTSFGPRSKNSFWERGHLNAWCYWSGAAASAAAAAGGGGVGARARGSR